MEFGPSVCEADTCTTTPTSTLMKAIVVKRGFWGSFFVWIKLHSERSLGEKTVAHSTFPKRTFWTDQGVSMLFKNSGW